MVNGNTIQFQSDYPSEGYYIILQYIINDYLTEANKNRPRPIVNMYKVVTNDNMLNNIMLGNRLQVLNCVK
jgi:hypothetical protein